MQVRAETIHRYIGASRYFVSDVYDTSIRMSSIDTKRYTHVMSHQRLWFTGGKHTTKPTHC